MELQLIINWIGHSWDFEVFRELTPEAGFWSSSVLYLRDWPYTPWFREGGNVLW